MRPKKLQVPPAWEAGGTSQLPIRRYEAAGGVVADGTGRSVLVLLRPGRPGPEGQDEVRLPKGHIEPGEDCRQAAIREVGEEAGLSGLEILANLGRQTVEFDWQGYHYVREECYVLMRLSADSDQGQTERQFRRLWLAWDEALRRLTFEAEREWVRRGQAALREYRRSGYPADRE